MGGMTQMAMITGLNYKSINRVLNEQEYVGEEWLDKFCCTADTELWITDFPWYTPKELQQLGEWESTANRRYITEEEKRERRSRDVYVSPYYGVKKLPREGRGDVRPWKAGDGSRVADTD